MIDWVETIKVAAAIVGPFAGGTGVWAYLSARHKAQQDAPANMLASQADLVAALNAQTKTLLAEADKDRRVLRRRIDKQGSDLVKLAGQHANCERNLAEVRRQIDDMMRGPVATYPPGGANAAD